MKFIYCHLSTLESLSCPLISKERKRGTERETEREEERQGDRKRKGGEKSGKEGKVGEGRTERKKKRKKEMPSTAGLTNLQVEHGRILVNEFNKVTPKFQFLSHLLDNSSRQVQVLHFFFFFI